MRFVFIFAVFFTFATETMALNESRVEMRVPEAVAAYGVTGKGVTVAVLDRGITWDHPDFIDVTYFSIPLEIRKSNEVQNIDAYHGSYGPFFYICELQILLVLLTHSIGMKIDLTRSLRKLNSYLLIC